MNYKICRIKSMRILSQYETLKENNSKINDLESKNFRPKFFFEIEIRNEFDINQNQSRSELMRV